MGSIISIVEFFTHWTYFRVCEELVVLEDLLDQFGVGHGADAVGPGFDRRNLIVS